MKKVLSEAGCPKDELQNLILSGTDWSRKNFASAKAAIASGVSELSNYLTGRGEKIVKLQLLDGDLHLNRLPIKVESSKGQYVLKYGDVTPWKILSTAAKDLLRIPLVTCQLTSEFNTCGWYLREWIEPNGEKGNPKAQVFNFGVMCGLLFFLNGIDLHFENYVTTQTTVMPIDVECLMYPHDSLSACFNVNFLGVANEETNVRATNGQFMFRHYTEPYVNKSLISFIQHKIHSSHVFRDENGCICAIYDFISEFRQGFFDGVNNAIKYAQEIDNISCKNDWLTRKLYRPTRFYKLIINELCVYPPCIHKHILKSRLKFGGPPAIFPRTNVVDMEIKQLLSGNIPIFHIGATSGFLFSAYRKVDHQLPDSPYMLWRAKCKETTYTRIRDACEKLIKRFKLWRNVLPAS